MILRRAFVSGLGLAAVSGVGARALAFNGAGQAGGAADATPPPDFDSNHNYVMYGGGDPIRDLRVTVQVDQDMVAPQSMSFQLNVTSPKDGDCVYQQYIILIEPKPQDELQFLGVIENFPSKAFRWQLHTSAVSQPCHTGTTEADCTGNLFNYPLPRVPFATFPGLGARIPAGFKIRFDILNDGRGRLTGAKYTVIDKSNAEHSTGAMIIRSIDYVGTTTKVQEDALAPNLAFQLDLVGNGGGRHTELTSGAGKITYEASTPLTPLPGYHGLADLAGTGTEESSNLIYSKLPSGAQRKIVQGFIRASNPLTPRRQGPH